MLIRSICVILMPRRALFMAVHISRRACLVTSVALLKRRAHALSLLDCHLGVLLELPLNPIHVERRAALQAVLVGSAILVARFDLRKLVACVKIFLRWLRAFFVAAGIITTIPVAQHVGFKKLFFAFAFANSVMVDMMPAVLAVMVPIMLIRSIRVILMPRRALFMAVHISHRACLVTSVALLKRRAHALSLLDCHLGILFELPLNPIHVERRAALQAVLVSSAILVAR